MLNHFISIHWSANILKQIIRYFEDNYILIPQQMLLKNITEVHLTSKFQKILCLSCAYDNTFVCVRVDRPGQEESIVHFDAQGKIKWEYQYKDIINTFGMLNDRQVIVMNVPESKIDIINLQTHKFIRVNHDYLFQDVAQMLIETFYDTKLFLVMQKGGFNDHRLRLSYYAYDGIQQTTEAVCQWQSKENEWTYDHFMRKGNNHSKIIWWMYKHQQEIQFNYFDLRDDPNGSLQKVVAVNKLGDQYNINNLEVSIGAIWETVKNQYMIVAISSKTEQKAKNKNGVINNNFILDASTGNQKAIVRQAKFDFGLQADGFSFNDQIIDFFKLGSVSVFHTFRHEKGNTLQTPVFYVNNQTEEIVAKETWKSSCYASNFFFPGWDSSLVVEGYFNNGDVQDITITMKKVMDPKEISLHFLLHVNQDYDDDLLQDAIELLHSH